MKRMLGFIGMLAVCLVVTAPAMAVPIIDFTQGDDAAGSLLVTAPNGGDVVGTDIPLSIMKTGGDGVYSVDAFLSFDTGYSSNYISIFGDVPSLDIYDQYLLQGSFTYFEYTWDANVLTFYGKGLDSKSANLLASLGIDQNTNWKFFGFTMSGDFASLPSVAGYGSGTAISTDILNTGVVPEPGTMLLLGSGLVGLGVMRKRRGIRK